MGHLSQLGDRQFETVAGLLIVMAGLAALRRPHAWLVGFALVAGGVTWIAPVISGGGASSLFLHRAFLAVALVAAATPARWRHWTHVPVVAFAIVCTVPGLASAPWLNGSLWLAVIGSVLVDSLPSPRRIRTIPALGSFAVMAWVATIGVEISWLGNDNRRLIYHVAAAATAILTARAARSPIVPEVILDVSADRMWTVGVRTTGEDPFVTIDGHPLTRRGTQREIDFELDGLGTAVLVHNDPAFDDAKLREPLRQAVRILAERIVLRRRIDSQAVEVEESRQRVLDADRIASQVMRREVDREVRPHLDAIERLLKDVGVTDERAAQLFDDVTIQIETLTAGTHQGLLALGLAQSLRALAARSGVHVSVRVDELELDGELSRALFLVASEAVTNAAKHSGAQQLTIELLDEGAEVVLRVSDDGCGGASFLDGGGLAGARSRVVSLGGSLDLDSRGGTVVTVRVPVPG